jgi:hypothetical protein
VKAGLAADRDVSPAAGPEPAPSIAGGSE